ncbi:hypothetical protein CGC20_18970 [Leishmania donovani]|uniref:Uncharacterized protein n=1 Tax=Leishmania donovani TaxID=5661 RepID=A0A504XWF7_LEIDO|nr:hypothetical protein CGC20_18970 [Leishmania donovani]
MLALLVRRVRLSFTSVFGPCEVERKGESGRLAELAMPEEPPPTACITDLVAGLRRHADMPRNPATRCDTRRQVLLGGSRPTPEEPGWRAHTAAEDGPRPAPQRHLSAPGIPAMAGGRRWQHGVQTV